MLNLISQYITAVWATTCELAPWFLVGALVAGLLHGLAPSGFVRKRFQGKTGVVWSVLLGIPLPLCSCAVIPTGLGLRRNGASEGSSIGFLIATPQTGVDSVFVTAAFLGWTFALYKLAVALVLGLSAGWIIELWTAHRKQQEGAIAANETVSLKNDVVQLGGVGLLKKEITSPASCCSEAGASDIEGHAAEVNLTVASCCSSKERQSTSTESEEAAATSCGCSAEKKTAAAGDRAGAVDVLHRAKQSSGNAATVTLQRAAPVAVSQTPGGSCCGHGSDGPGKTIVESSCCSGSAANAASAEPVSGSCCSGGQESELDITALGYVVSSLKSSVSIVRSIYRWVVLGVLVSAALTTLVPMEWFTGLLGDSYWLQLTAALLISIPLYVCATASVPIAAALVSRGLSVGASAVFLIAGPATNVATIGAVRSQFSRFATTVYLVATFVGSLVFAILFDALFPGQLVGAEALHHHEHLSWWHQASAVVLVLLFVYFAVQKWLPVGRVRPTAS